MQIRLSIADPSARPAPGSSAGPAPVDVLVDVAPGTRLQDVTGRLLTAAGVLPAGAPDENASARFGFVANGDAVAADAIVGEPPLVHGVLLTLDRGEPRPPGATAGSLVELHVVGGPDAGQVVRVGRGTHLVGRGATCGVRLEDPGISRVHAELVVSDEGVVLRDLSTTNGTTVDGRQVPTEGAALDDGSRLSLASTTLVRRRTQVNPAATTGGLGTVQVHRRPRLVARAPAVTIDFPQTPQQPEGHRLPLIAAIAPVILAVVLAWVLTSPAMLLFALMSPVMLLGQWLSDRRHGRMSHRRRLAEYTRATAAAQELLESSLAAEAVRRQDEQPDLARVRDVAVHRDARLWERRPTDHDYLVMRVGTAKQPARLTITGGDDAAGGPKQTGPGPAPPEVPDVPALLDLRAAGVAGICGPRGRVLSIVGGLLAQLATWHSPLDVRLVVLTTAERPDLDWGWAARLPHAGPLETGSCVATVAGRDDESALAARVAELEAIVRSRTERALRLGAERSASRSQAGHEPPDIVVVLDGSHDLRLTPGVADLLRAGPTAGVRFLCVDETVERLPVETTQHVTLDAAPAPAAVLSGDSGQIAEIVPDLPRPGWLELLGRALAPLEDATPDRQQSGLPARVGFADLHRDATAGSCDPTDPEAVARAWARSSGVPRAPLGVGRTGPYAVQLDRDGPHTLVGGTTGSGKSELLQTLVAGLAVSCHPDQLAFVLVDYKGGSAFKDCARLPHTLGVVTDLDEHLTTRALTSLGAELKRRERVLADAGAKDLADYQRRAGPGAPALPRLVLVVDEFKMLADELPDFVDGLVRIAAVGRSLGIHLVLATQRPGGIVSGDMRANVSLRIALRVRDRADSEDVIEAADAAAISDRHPGRGWIRTSGELLEIQTAHVGGPADIVAAASMTPIVQHLPWSALGHPPPTRAEPQRADTPRTELAAVVDATRAAANALGAKPLPSPWLPALPELLPADALLPLPSQAPGAAGRDRPLGQRAARLGIGLVDLPNEQRQAVWDWDLEAGHLAIAGGSRTGRSTALRTIALTLADHYGPEEVHLHILEGASGGLADLAGLPHVGSVTGTADPIRARRAIARLVHQLTAPAPAEPVSAPPASAAAGESQGRQSPAPRAPRTVVLVDGWESLKECLDEIEHGQPVDDLVRLLRDGLAARIHVVVTGGRAVIAGQLPSLLQHRLVLALPDPLDLVLAGIPTDAVPTHQPPGRAVDAQTGAEVQLAFHGEHPDRSGQTAATRVAALAATARWGAAGPGRAWRVAELPATIDLADIPDPGLPRLAIGVGGDDLEPLGFDLELDQRRILVAGAARTGRSTTLLALAHRLLAGSSPATRHEETTHGRGTHHGRTEHHEHTEHHRDTEHPRPTDHQSIEPQHAGGARHLAVVTTRRSPLTQLGGIPRVHLLTPHDRDAFVDLRRERPDIAILVDDAEGIEGTPIEAALIEATRLADAATGLVAIAIDLRRGAEHYRGLVPHVAALATGVLLSPSAVGDGDAFRIRVEPRAGRHPGRGLLIADAAATPIQVGMPARSQFVLA